ncbi:hypothetical protein M514_10973 [Trichuris suis]|uniref:ADP-ribose pyrophosphatase, mitochondrial n=1 Tax=Trichuris suis TaxID=68888 RepID=A0A085MX00_9BILA|nr:hypothetical protein M514_10973 [Trichuris suis]
MECKKTMKCHYTPNRFAAPYEFVRLTLQSCLASALWEFYNSRAGRGPKTWDDTYPPYVGTQWNVDCCWKECDPPFTDPFFSPKFNEKDGKIDRRRLKTRCKFPKYLVRGEKPWNPAGPTGYAGRGLFPRWGPNFFVRALLIRKQKRTTEILLQESGYAYFEGFVDDVTNDPLPEILRLFADEGLTRSGYGAEQKSMLFNHVLATFRVPVNITRFRKPGRPYVGTRWNVACCWDKCDPFFTDPLFKPQFNARDGNIDRRRVWTQCGRLTYTVQNGVPSNPAGITGYSGRGLFRRWGPNFYTKVLIAMREKNQVYVLWKKNGTSFYEGFVDNFDEGFPKFLVDLFNKALYIGKVEGTEHTELIQEARKNLKLYISGSVPHPWNTDNAWIEISNYVFRCDKSPVLCKAFLKYVGKDYQWRPWANMHTTKELLAELKRSDTQRYRINANYSAFCALH